MNRPGARHLLKDETAKQVLMDGAAQGLTNPQIAALLEKRCGYRWNEETVRRARKQLRLSASDTGLRPDRTTSPALATPAADLSAAAKADWFREQFRGSHLYPTLIKQFDADEVAIYLEEYGQVCTQFEDIVASEFFQIDDFLKHRLLINRQLARMRELRQQIESHSQWLAEHPVADAEQKEERLQRVEQYRILEGLRGEMNRASERYDKLVAERQKTYQNLAATRRDRVDELKSGGDSFFALVAAIQQNDQVRSQNGRYAELTRLAAQDIHTEFREETAFPDGGKAPIILDDRVEPPPDEETEDAEEPEETP